MIRLKSLLFEVSLDQLKTQFVDTGKISDSEFTEIVDASGGKSAYATWLTKQVATKIIKPEDLYKYNSYFKIFDRRKREYPFQDINQYKTSDDIAQFISKSVEIGNKEKADPSQQKGVAKTDRYAEFKIGEVEGFTVYELPKGRKDLYGASCELGSGTEWCTATGKTEKYFKQYISKGPLFIFIKPGSDEKYQFSYQERQFMDKDDNSITRNITPTIIKLFEFIQSKKSRYPIYQLAIMLKILYAPESIENEDLHIRGSLNFTSFDNFKDVEHLPDNLHIDGDLWLSDSAIKTLPENLHVNGNLALYRSKIQSLPKNLYVGGNISLMYTPLAEKYTDDEIQQLIEKSGGVVKGRIIGGK
jgi:hypothetical protein